MPMVTCMERSLSRNPDASVLASGAVLVPNATFSRKFMWGTAVFKSPFSNCYFSTAIRSIELPFVAILSP